MIRVPQMFSVLLALAMCATAASALTSEQVVVVVNQDVAESVALGRYYAQQRSIPEANVIALSMPSEGAISMEAYRGRIVQPLRAEIERRGLTEAVRCLVTVYGVPYRIEAGRLDPINQTSYVWSGQARDRARGQVAVAYELAKVVGTHFPPKAFEVDGPVRLADVFDITPTLPTSIPQTETSYEHFKAEADSAERRISALTDRARQTVARRQLLTLWFEVEGIGGAFRYIQRSEPDDMTSLQQMHEQMQTVNRELATLGQGPTTEETLGRTRYLLGLGAGAMGVHSYAAGQRQQLEFATSGAAVDSELAMLFADDYPTDGKGYNPLGWRFPAGQRTNVPRTIMTSRLDGPSVAGVVRLIADSIATEQQGLTGRVYVDAGGRAPAFDEHLFTLARVMRQTRLPVVLEKTSALFAPNSCPEAALYVGWYSLQEYIPSFQWVRGSVGYHVASWEAVHLRDPGSREWVPQMLANGVAATLGAVEEPLLDAFPLPQDFFPLLVTGEMTIAEVYWRTIPHVSWRMLLIADPLYNPFKNNPQPIQLARGLAPPAARAARPATQQAPTAPATQATTQPAAGAGE